MHSTTRRKSGAAGASCTPTRPGARRFLRPPGLLVVRLAAGGHPLGSPTRYARGFAISARCAPSTHGRNWSRRPELHRHGRWGPAGFESAVSTRSNHAAKLVRTEGFAPSWACAHRLLGPARILFRHVRMKWSIHRDLRPAVCLTTAVRRFLRVGCKMVEAEGLAPS